LEILPREILKISIISKLNLPKEVSALST
jgi:hypothetical protein